MHSVRVAGTSGRLTRSYYTVARLGAWSLSERGEFTCHELADVNEALLDSPVPLGLSLDVGRTVWTWSDVAATSLRPVRAVVTGRPVITRG